MGLRGIDLCCGAGGASAGYARAGFEMSGIDHKPQPRYPFPFTLGDALEADLSGFDFVHASPPCQEYSKLNTLYDERPERDILVPMREKLIASGLPYVIENVEHSPLRGALWLCGSEFGLTTTHPRFGEVVLRRHRGFESNVFLFGAGGCNCHGRTTVPVYGHGAGGPRTACQGPGLAKASREVMRIDWMSRNELSQAIPPAYTAFVGEQIIAHIRERRGE